jgi:hypothetical protein
MSSNPPSRLPEQIAGLGRRDERPRLNQAADLVRAGLTPTEGFVLSRVDGATSYEAICQLTGLGVDVTLEILRKLRADRLILGPGEVAPGRPAPASPAPAAARPASLLELFDDGSPIDPAEMAGGADLDSVLKARIIRLHRRLKALQPHELLGVPAGADVATVRKAYFAASKELHPDRHYGREIGGFRDKLNDIFAQLTHAFEQLQRTQPGTTAGSPKPTQQK